MDVEEINETLYVQNLNEKIRTDEMKILLYQLFAQYGRVIDINMKNQYRMRGQAFVVYDSKEDAMNAMRLLQNFYFYGKSLKISYALAKSDLIAKREGVFLPRSPSHCSKKRSYFFQKLKNKQNQVTPLNGGSLGAHHILFAERIDPGLEEDVLRDLFALYPGLKEVRVIHEKHVAFVEYYSSQEASVALAGLRNYTVKPNYSLNLSYAKR